MLSTALSNDWTIENLYILYLLILYSVFNQHYHTLIFRKMYNCLFSLLKKAPCEALFYLFKYTIRMSTKKHISMPLHYYYLVDILNF